MDHYVFLMVADFLPLPCRCSWIGLTRLAAWQHVLSIQVVEWIFCPRRCERSSSFARLQRMQGRMALRNRWRNITLQHQPQNAVIELIIHAIGCAEIQTL